MYLALIAGCDWFKIITRTFWPAKTIGKKRFKDRKAFKDCLASAFTLTLGDEFQALLKVEAPVFKSLFPTFRTKTDSTSFRHWPRGGVADIDPCKVSVQMDQHIRMHAINLVRRKMIMATQIYFFWAVMTAGFSGECAHRFGETLRSGWRESEESCSIY